MDEFLPSLEVVYRRLGVVLATSARGRARGVWLARTREEDRAATRPARTKLCMVSVAPKKQKQSQSLLGPWAT